MKFGFNDELTEAEEIYRNTLISSSRLMNAEELAALKFTFQARPNEEGEPIELNFTPADF